MAECDPSKPLLLIVTLGGDHCCTFISHRASEMHPRASAYRHFPFYFCDLVLLIPTPFCRLLYRGRGVRAF